MHQRMHERLVVWQEAYALCLSIYEITKKFPSYEQFGLTDQMRRSSVSVPTNIAEGNAKRSRKERNRFFEIAAASLEELHVEVRISRDVGYIDAAIFDRLNEKISRVSVLITKFRQANSSF